MNGPLFAIDPSTTSTGWAVLTAGGRLLQAGIVTGSKQTDPAELRIAVICRDLGTLFDGWQPGTILIEWPSPHVGRRRHKGLGAGLAVYGAAAGALWWASLRWAEQQEPGVSVNAVSVDLWTRGVPKEDRLAAVAQQFPEYRGEADPGGDIGDAIGLGVWWIQERVLVPF